MLLFDVSETLSDLSPLGDRFVDVGAPDHLTRTWLATLLLDGMALTAARAQAHFGQLAIGTLRSSLTGLALNRPVDEAIAHIMAGSTSSAFTATSLRACQPSRRSDRGWSP